MTAKLPKTDGGDLSSCSSSATAGTPGCEYTSAAGFWDKDPDGKTPQESMPALANSTKKTDKTTKAPAATTTGCADSKNGQAGECTESATVQDEGLYWWDVSVGVPFKGPNQLQFSNGNVSPKTVSKHTAYGFLWKQDAVTPPSLGIPHPMVGVPLTGKVLDTPFVGLGETINLTKVPGLGKGIAKFSDNLSARFYAGCGWNKQFSPAAMTDEVPPHKWVRKLQIGIEFAVKDVKDQLTGASKNSTKSSQSSN